MPAEGDATWPITIVACQPPNHLRVDLGDSPNDTWHVEIRITEAKGVTTLEFVHHLEHDTPLDQVAPGWDFYLDRLTASRDNQPLPAFDGYIDVLGPRYLDDRFQGVGVRVCAMKGVHDRRC